MKQHQSLTVPEGSVEAHHRRLHDPEVVVQAVVGGEESARQQPQVAPFVLPRQPLLCLMNDGGDGEWGMNVVA